MTLLISERLARSARKSWKASAPRKAQSPKPRCTDCTQFGPSDIVAEQLNTLFLSRVAEGQARRSHGNHATAPQVAVRCQFLPSPDSEGEMREERCPSIHSLRQVTAPAGSLPASSSRRPSIVVSA